ncbi:MAG: hypothetical protein V4754_14755 [Pseudomonadota bacterium]
MPTRTPSLRSPSLFNYRILCIPLALSFCAPASGAELGELTVRSFIGQPLLADIELTAVAPDEAGDLQVRLASPDVYRGANVGIDPALQSLSVAVLRREQRTYLHLSSSKPVNASYVHLFLELSGAGRNTVRAATAWLSADPSPKPSAAASAQVVPAVPAVPEPLSPAVLAARARAATHMASATVAANRPLPAPLHAAQATAGPADQASHHATQTAAQRLANAAGSVSDPKAEAGAHAHEAGAAASVASAGHNADAAAPAHLTGLVASGHSSGAASAHPTAVSGSAHAAGAASAHRAHRAVPVAPKRGAPAAACPALPLPEGGQCHALDEKNAVLTDKLAQLEDKLKLLQEELGRKRVDPPPERKPAAVKGAKPKPLIGTAAPKKADTPSRAIWWATGGAAVLLLSGVAVYLFRRRRTPRTARPPSKYWVMLGKPFSRKKRAPAGIDQPPAEAGPAPASDTAAPE